MKAELTLPERPAIVHLLAVLDVLVLLLVFFMLITNVAREAGVSAVELSPTQFRLPHYGSKVVVTAKGGAVPVLHVGLQRVQMDELEGALQRAVDESGAEAILLMSDRMLPVGVEWKIREAAMKLDMDVLLVGQRAGEEVREESSPDPLAPPPLPDEKGEP